MENQTEVKSNIQKRIMDWHRVSKIVILFSKFFILLFLLCIIATLTYKYVDLPYSIYLIGIEFAIFTMVCFMIIRMSTFKPIGQIQLPRHFNPNDEQSKLLWFNLTYDINKYEEGSSYYFNGVRVYKYSTILLSGLSTIILGLDLGNIKIGLMEYPTFSKNMALVIGAIVTISTSLMTYWNIEKYWLINKTIVNKLRALRDELENAFTSNSLDKTAIQEKVKKYSDIKETFNKYWEGALSERSSQSGQEKQH
jgi:hypothetical protein